MTERTPSTGKGDLINDVQKATGLDPQEAKAAVTAVVDAMAKSLLAGDPVILANFGTLYPAESSARAARNPRTGEKLQVPARRTVRWRPSPTLKRVLNGEEDRPTLSSKLPSRGR